MIYALRVKTQFSHPRHPDDVITTPRMIWVLCYPHLSSWWWAPVYMFNRIEAVAVPLTTEELAELRVQTALGTIADYTEYINVILPSTVTWEIINFCKVDEYALKRRTSIKNE